MKSNGKVVLRKPIFKLTNFQIIVMAEKKALVLRINQETSKLLEKWAADEFRSLNGQIEFLLQKALVDAGRIKKKV